jgi:hypothetical protein
MRKYGKPRVYYVDRRAAYVAGSLSAICASDAEAKGVIER